MVKRRSRSEHRQDVEPMPPDVAEWEFARTGDQSCASTALPWTVNKRDKQPMQSEWDYVVGYPYSVSTSAGRRRL